MQFILDSEDFAHPCNVEACVGAFLQPFETLSVVQWEKPCAYKTKAPKDSWRQKPALKHAETHFARTKRIWRRSRHNPHLELPARHDMLNAKAVLNRLRQKYRRAYEPGNWETVARLCEQGRGDIFWKKLQQKKNDDAGSGTLDILGRRIACASKMFSLVPPFFSRLYLSHSYYYYYRSWRFGRQGAEV